MVKPRIALMSIHPQYAEKILAGQKRIELRRQRPRLHAGDIVVVYVTSPLKQIAGAFSVAGVLSMSVERMWRRFRSVLGVERDAFYGYYADRKVAHGISIERVWASEPVALPHLRERFDGFVPPQSYMFWPDRWTLPSEWPYQTSA
jgi:predicted transcriptional regulator